MLFREGKNTGEKVDLNQKQFRHSFPIKQVSAHDFRSI